jgi:hypothetical protein
LLGKDSGSVVGAGLDGWRIHCFDHDGLAVWESGASMTCIGDAAFDTAHDLACMGGLPEQIGIDEPAGGSRPSGLPGSA